MGNLNKQFQRMLEEEMKKHIGGRSEGESIKVVQVNKDGSEETIAEGDFILGAIKEGENIEETGIIVAGKSRPTDLVVLKYMMNKVVDQIVDNEMMGGL